MKNFFGGMIERIKEKKGYFLLLIIALIGAIVLAVFASLSISSGSQNLDLGNIAYIRFLRGQSSLVSLMFSLAFNLVLFYFLILMFSSRRFLFPFAVLFFMYFAYCQVLVLIHIIMVFGFFNCILLAIILLLYDLILILLFMIAMLEMANHTQNGNYFKTCFSTNFSKVLFYFYMILIFACIFAIILSILKSFVILLVFN